MFGKLNTKEIDDLIYSQFIGRLASHADGVTYIVPVSYAYDGEYIYARSFEGMKMNMLRKNPSVCFQVDNTHNLANWQSAVCWGHFEELTETEPRKKALKILIDRALPIISSETMHITPQWPFSTENIEAIDGVIFRIKLFEKTGRFEKTSEEFFFAS